MAALTADEYDQALADYYASGGEPIEIKSVSAFVVDPATGKRAAGAAVSTIVAPGKWNETRFTVDADGTKRINWGETLQARVENAPVLYLGGTAAAGFLLWRTFR